MIKSFQYGVRFNSERKDEFIAWTQKQEIKILNDFILFPSQNLGMMNALFREPKVAAEAKLSFS